jgi:hypothetical protein
MNSKSRKATPADRGEHTVLINGLTLIALGLSILFLNSWDTLVVRTSVGFFWGAFFLVLHGPHALRTLRQLKQKHDTQRRGSYTIST